MKIHVALTAALAVVLLIPMVLAHCVRAQPVPRHIAVTARQFDFEPGEITVRKGEPVVIELKSVDVAHSLRFRELGIETRADKGKISELAFTPDKTGDFVGHCGVFCGEGHRAMTITLHVVN